MGSPCGTDTGQPSDGHGHKDSRSPPHSESSVRSSTSFAVSGLSLHDQLPDDPSSLQAQATQDQAVPPINCYPSASHLDYLYSDPFFEVNFNFVDAAALPFPSRVEEWQGSSLQPELAASGSGASLALPGHASHLVDLPSFPFSSDQVQPDSAPPTLPHGDDVSRLGQPKSVPLADTTPPGIMPLALDSGIPGAYPSLQDLFNDGQNRDSNSGSTPQDPKGSNTAASELGRDDDALAMRSSMESRLPFASNAASGRHLSSAGIAPGPNPFKRGRQDGCDVGTRDGLDPGSRPGDEVPTVKESTAQRKVEERNREIEDWLDEDSEIVFPPPETSTQELSCIEQLPAATDDGIPLGNKTENLAVVGQTYYREGGRGRMNSNDRAIIASDRNWANAPVIQRIITDVPGRNQPPSSQAAIERFQRMCRETDSIISRTATWGTFRRSYRSESHAGDDVPVVTSGNILKKLSTRRRSDSKSNKPANLLKDIRGIVRGSGQYSQRKEQRNQDQLSGNQWPHEITSLMNFGSQLASAPRALASAPRVLNSAFSSVAHNVASIGAASRDGLLDAAATAVAVPMNSIATSLMAMSPPRQARRGSENSKPMSESTRTESLPHMMALWRRSGGPPRPPKGHLGWSPPVSASSSSSRIDLKSKFLLDEVIVDGEDEDEDDADEDNDDDEDHGGDDDDEDELQKGYFPAMPASTGEATPSFSFFRDHVMALNPALDINAYGYLVDRIAHQQLIRYKRLLAARVEHDRTGINCPNGRLCIALGGSARMLDAREAERRSVDQNSDPDDEASPSGDIMRQDRLPLDIPMPPTQRLPAEIECQLCYRLTKLRKPSDWTKHVHEDVQPFTCTWDRCRDAKMFKRKADWIRHENEGHRHLEWWTCDMANCTHTSYRRNNFIQHLAREHKLHEPRNKQGKRTPDSDGRMDSWQQRVERCHAKTSARPQDEPCRFCNRTFTTWKKLYVHLAKHMVQISLPVLHLAAAGAQEPGAGGNNHDLGLGPNAAAAPSTELQPAPAAGQAPGWYSDTTEQIQHQQHMASFDRESATMGHGEADASSILAYSHLPGSLIQGAEQTCPSMVGTSATASWAALDEGLQLAEAASSDRQPSRGPVPGPSDSMEE